MIHNGGEGGGEREPHLSTIMRGVLGGVEGDCLSLNEFSSLWEEKELGSNSEEGGFAEGVLASGGPQRLRHRQRSEGKREEKIGANSERSPIFEGGRGRS